MQKYIIIFGGGAWFIYSLLYRPNWIAILLFTSVIADINFTPPGSPLNFRWIVGLVLMAKILSSSGSAPGPSFLSSGYSKAIIAFIVYILLVSYMNGLFTADMLKEFLFTLMITYLAYYHYMKEGGYKLFKISMILSGFICLGDLIWTYLQGGGLAIQRIYFSFVPAWDIVNHNFLGYICAIAFVFLLSDYLTDTKTNNKWQLKLMPFMFLGVLLSTSRSSLLILIIISLVLITKGLMSRQNSSKAYKLVVISVSCLIISLFLFQILAVVFNVNSEFMEQITGRLIDEPVAIFNRAMGYEFKAESLDSMDWRGEASEIAYHAFMNILTTTEQVLGIGYGGFMGRNLGFMGVYAAHNGVLLMLIEFGVVGFLIYHLTLASLLSKTMRSGYFSPLAICIVYIFLFMVSHNNEMTSFLAFLIVGSLIAEVEYTSVPQEEPEMENESIAVSTDTANN